MAAMAGVDTARADELKLQLRSKLAREWSSDKLASSLTPASLRAAIGLFPSLTPDVQTRLVLSLLCLPDPLPRDMVEPSKQLVELAAKWTGEGVEWLPVAAAMVGHRRRELACDACSSAYATHITGFAEELATELAKQEAKWASGRSAALDPLFTPREFLYMNEDLLEVPIARPKPNFTSLAARRAEKLKAKAKRAAEAAAARAARPAPTSGNVTGTKRPNPVQASGPLAKRPRAQAGRDAGAGGGVGAGSGAGGGAGTNGPRRGGLGGLLKQKKQHSVKIMSVGQLREQTAAAQAQAAATASAAVADWQRAAMKAFRRKSIKRLKRSDWELFLKFQSKSYDATKNNKSKIIIDTETGKDGDERVIVAKLDYTTGTYKMVRARAKSKGKKAGGAKKAPGKAAAQLP